MTTPDIAVESLALSRLRKQLEAVTPVLPDKAIVTLGAYTLETMAQSPHLQGGAYTLIRVNHKKELRHKTLESTGEEGLVLDTLYEPHYWFEAREAVEGRVSTLLDRHLYHYHREVLAVANGGEGLASGLLPPLVAHQKAQGKQTLTTLVYPAKTHSSDAHYNALSAVGRMLADGSTPLLLLEQEALEGFHGVTPQGEPLTGPRVLDYLLDLLLEKENVVRELDRLSSNYGAQVYSAYMAAGCSLGIYESLRNILEISLEQPLMEPGLGEASLIYVLVRAPKAYMRRFQKGLLEVEVAAWLQESLGLDLPQICEPLFAERLDDRVDALILVGGAGPRERLSQSYARVRRFSDMNLEKGYVDQQEWRSILEALALDP